MQLRQLRRRQLRRHCGERRIGLCGTARFAPRWRRGHLERHRAHHGRTLPRPERRQRHRASASAAHSEARMPNFATKNRHEKDRFGAVRLNANVTLPSGPCRIKFTAEHSLACIHMNSTLRNGGVLGRRRPWRRAPRAMEAQLGMNLSQWSDDASWAADIAGRSQRTRDNCYRARWPYGGVDTAKIGSTSQT